MTEIQQDEQSAPSRVHGRRSAPRERGSLVFIPIAAMVIMLPILVLLLVAALR